MGVIITLTTDFNVKDHYVGAMKGAILSANPSALPVDISHSIRAGDIFQGAFVMKEACGVFPTGTVHLGVVDPGVGGPRRAIIVETERFLFVGPDNGLLSLASGGEGIKRIIEITNKKFFRAEVSATFHGRDIFGPVAGHLSRGVAPAEFGPETRDMDMISIPAPSFEEDGINGEVIHIDTYGNVITNIRAEFIASNLGTDKINLGIKGHVVEGLYHTYASIGPNGLGVLTGSSGRVEVAACEADGAKILGVNVGDRVRLTKR